MSWTGLPSLSALRAFEATARHLSFSAAGREMNVTHVAVSQQVRKLEEHLGVSLIVRRGQPAHNKDRYGRVSEANDGLWHTA